jgi:hypothetical protein
MMDRIRAGGEIVAWVLGYAGEIVGKIREVMSLELPGFLS